MASCQGLPSECAYGADLLKDCLSRFKKGQKRLNHATKLCYKLDTLSLTEAMDSLGDDVLSLMFVSLPPVDLLRVRAVCKRWKAKIDCQEFQSSPSTQSYCPVVFKRDEEDHAWLGYEMVRRQWMELPGLSSVPRVISLLPMAGSGKGLLGFRITTEYSGYVVGDPFTQEWTTLPKCLDDWGMAVMYMVVSEERKTFRIVAIQEGDTQMYTSEFNHWTTVDRTPGTVTEHTISNIKSKLGAALCDELLYTLGESGNIIISFDLRSERWREDRISLPDPTPTTSILVNFEHHLFVVTETVCGRQSNGGSNRIEIWGHGIHSNRLTKVVEMPDDMRDVLRGRNGTGHFRAEKLKSVGHKQHFFIWRQNSVIVAFHLLRRKWEVLPDFERPDSPDSHVVIDVGYFQAVD